MAGEYYSRILLSPDCSTLLAIKSEQELSVTKLDKKDSSDSIPVDQDYEIVKDETSLYASAIYSMDWYPQMNSHPSTHCFLYTKQEHPLTLMDANTKKQRFVYKTVNINTQESQSPIVSKFNLSGERIYSGFKGEFIQVFDIQGSDLGFMKLSPNKKSCGGVKGLVSGINFNKDRSGLFAVCSYEGIVGLYDEKSLQECLVLDCSSFDPITVSVDGVIGHKVNDDLMGSRKGLTQAEFSSCGNYLITTARKSNHIKIWDVRNTCQTIFSLDRKGDTNQRIWFEINQDTLYTGDTGGNVFKYNVVSGEEIASFNTGSEKAIGAIAVGLDRDLYTCEGSRSYIGDSDLGINHIKRFKNKA
jgi:WD40 repeat protein